MEYAIGILSLICGAAFGVIEGSIYPLTSPRREFLFGLAKASSGKPPLWHVMLERVFIPLLMTLAFLMVMLLFWPIAEPTRAPNPWLLLSFFPGFASVSTLIVAKRWRKERNKDQR